MDDESEEIRRAAEAQALIDSPAFVSAFEALRASLTRQMSAVKLTDAKTKNKLIDLWQATDSLERWLVKTIQTGEAAELRLEEKKFYEVWK